MTRTIKNIRFIHLQFFELNIIHYMKIPKFKNLVDITYIKDEQRITYRIQ